MQGYLTIILGEDESRIELSPRIGIDEYFVTIFVKDMTSFEEIKDDENLFNDMIKNYGYVFGTDGKYKRLTKYVSENAEDIKKFICTCNEISIDGDYLEVRSYIEENGFQNKKVLYNEILPLKKETVMEVTKVFGDMPFVEFFIEGNADSITLDDYTKTVEKVEEIALEVRKLGLSPIEEIMFVYDLVRDREYVEEDTTEEYTVSRDLTSVMFGDKIVCVGFAKLFNAILSRLGHKTMNFTLTPLKDGNGHMRSLIYVKDDKYDINGMFFFDPTYDCKRDNNNSFLERYLCFAKNYKQMTKLDDGSLFSEYYNFMNEDFIDDIEELFQEDEIHLLDLYKKIKLSVLNSMLRFAELKEFTIFSQFVSKEDLIEILCEISFLTNREITSDKFLEILYNVRKKQYYMNPEKYAFDMDTITNILAKSRVSRKSEDNQEKLLVALLGLESVVGAKEAPEKVKEFFEAGDLEKDMARVKLTRTLKNVLEKKEEEEKKLSFKK